MANKIDNATTQKKEILVFLFERSIGLLIPKKRGQGFKKIPLGHHNCPLSQLEREIGFDIYGLEGYLDVITGWIDDSNREEMIKRVIEPLAEFHEFPWRITSHSEFFDNLIKTRG